MSSSKKFIVHLIFPVDCPRSRDAGAVVTRLSPHSIPRMWGRSIILHPERSTCTPENGGQGRTKLEYREEHVPGRGHVVPRKVNHAWLCTYWQYYLAVSLNL